uniref:NTF2-like domain-containing protein n=1 Tax=Caenorhabditis japonica TaxID=281687 RepID=A0A8R1EA99_CAEJA
MRCCLQLFTISALLFGALNSTIFLDQNDSNEVVTRFVAAIAKAIQDGDSIDSFFSDDFSYRTCLKTFNKTQVVKFLSMLKVGPQFASFNLIKSKYYDNNAIMSHVSISSPYGKHVEGVFYLSVKHGDLQLWSGSAASCERNLHKNEDGSELIVRSLLEKMNSAIASGSRTTSG